MEAHPVPQNVTSFEFRLIGDMTLKQFIYLAAGVTVAYLTFVFFANNAPLVAWPVIIVSAFLGVAFAFIPIANRPLDHWASAFLKAIYSPTKRSWSKNGKDYLDPLFAGRLKIYLSAHQTPMVTQPIEPQPLVEEPFSTPVPTPQSEPEKLPTPAELTKTVKLASEAQALQIKMIETERNLSQIKTNVSKPQVNPKAEAEEFNTIFDSLKKLNQEAQLIKQELSSLTNAPELPPVPKIKVTVKPPSKPKPTQLVLTSQPNVINGIVVDSTANYLEGVVVVIHDRDGLPVRALKTNKLGQFTGSTPLPNGTYTVELEKDNLIFDVLQIELEGKVLPPLTIAAKRAIGNS